MDESYYQLPFKHYKLFMRKDKSLSSEHFQENSTGVKQIYVRFMMHLKNSTTVRQHDHIFFQTLKTVRSDSSGLDKPQRVLHFK